MLDPFALAEILELGSELGSTVASDDLREPEVVEPAFEGVDDLGGCQGFELGNEGEALASVRHDEEVLAGVLEQIHSHDVHGERVLSRPEGLPLLARL